MSDIAAFIAWWFAATIVGWVAWPLAARFLGRLPDLGFTLSKAFGLLLVGYVFWLLSSFDYLRLDAGGIFLALAVVALASLAATRGGHARRLGDWLSVNVRVVVAAEAVFIVAFAAWAYVRALNPEITATEKPMEFAFLNSILRSETMPPRDPWLSGYAISYYYFGYVIMAILTRASGALPSVAFNLSLALLFGLTALGAFGIVLNMIASSRDQSERRGLKKSLTPALLGPLFVVVSGNLTGLLEVLYARGVGAVGFWRWLNIRDLDSIPLATASGLPERFLWWWRASRVIRDVDLHNIPIGLEPIDEFPSFSFLLGDLHPHVLALPFVFVALAIALHLYLDQRNSGEATRGWIVLPTLTVLVYSVVLGGLSFLNTWDFPIYVFVVTAAFAAARGARRGWARRVWLDSVAVGVSLTVVGVLLYLPFYISFRSQASGILPNPLYPTRLNQFVVMFGVALIPIVGWLTWVTLRARRLNWRAGLATGPGVLGVLAALCGLLTLVIAVSDLDAAREAVRLVLGDAPISGALPLILKRRLLDAPWVAALLTGILAAAGAVLFAGTRRTSAGRAGASGSVHFPLLLVATGALLTLGPEFVYLRDTFGMRMNTIFKFYYQAWVLWGCAAAFAVWHVTQYGSAAWRRTFAAGTGLLLAAGLVYPVLAVRTKTADFAGTTLLPDGTRIATLNGMAYMQTSRAEDYAAIRWLNARPALEAVIAEAVGGSYTEYARVSVHTGLPTVIGWPGHELQWRGGFDEAGGREEDIRVLYSTTRWDEARSILDRYAIEYVYVGPLERSQFPESGLEKFTDYMQPVYDRDGVTIYNRIDAGEAG